MNVELIKVYYAGAHANKVLPQNYHIKEPAGNGYARALIIQREKRTLVFDPFNFQGWDVANHCGEINVLNNGHQEPAPRYDMDVEFWKKFLLEKWHHFAALNMNKDWLRASIIMKELGAEVPKVMTAEAVDAMEANGEDVTGIIIQKPKKQRSAGKEVNPEGFKPLKKQSKRGMVCDFFLKDTPQPIVECMSEFGMSRSNVLSHLSCANRDQGWGYDIVGDCVKTVVPEGEEPWEFDILN